jgi:WXG100 family type VII secretion target
MDGNIKVSFGSMEALAGDIGGRVNSIESLIETLRSQIANLEMDWEGSAGPAFQATKNQWNVSADSLKQVLAKIQTAVMQSTEGYQQTEQRNTARWEG